MRSQEIPAEVENLWFSWKTLSCATSFNLPRFFYSKRQTSSLRYSKTNSPVHDKLSVELDQLRFPPSFQKADLTVSYTTCVSNNVVSLKCAELCRSISKISQCHLYTTQFVPSARPRNVVRDRAVNKILPSPKESVILS